MWVHSIHCCWKFRSSGTLSSSLLTHFQLAWEKIFPAAFWDFLQFPSMRDFYLFPFSHTPHPFSFCQPKSSVWLAQQKYPGTQLVQDQSSGQKDGSERSQSARLGLIHKGSSKWQVWSIPSRVLPSNDHVCFVGPWTSVQT